MSKRDADYHRREAFRQKAFRDQALKAAVNRGETLQAHQQAWHKERESLRTAGQALADALEAITRIARTPPQSVADETIVRTASGTLEAWKKANGGK